MESESTPEGVSLLPATQLLIRRTELTTGRRIRIDTARGLAGHVRAVYAVSESDNQTDVIRVAPAERDHIDHLIAHELGHVRQLATAPFDERTVPVVSPRVRLNAGHLLSRELLALIDRGLPSMLVPPMMMQWTNSLVSQLADTPPDIAIERSIWFEEPDLRVAQETSLRGQVEKIQRVFAPAGRSLLPPTVSRSHAAMAYAYARNVADILSDPSLFAPFQGTPAETAGEALLDTYRAESPGSLGDFRRVSHCWAATLGIQGLLEFRHLAETRRKS